jgi:hypothetical protein
MFPNVRLMIVAVLASIMGISSALGLFAEFRVSHDSFLRESNAGGPLQLSAGAPPATVMNAAATFGVRFAAEPAPPAVDGTLSSQAFDRAVAVETPRATPSPRAEPAPTAVPAAPSAIAPEPSSQIATAPQPATSAATADFAPGPAGPAASSSIPSQSAAPDIQKNPKPKAADNKPAEAKPAEAKPAETKPAETKPAETKPAEAKPAEAKPAETKPADNLAEQPPAAPHSAPAAAPAQTKSTPESQRAPERAAAAAVRRHTTARHRPLIARRVPRTRAAATTQSFTATQPLYQWTQPGQSAQPVRRRPIARRTRPIPKSAQQPQAALSNTSPPDRPE